MLFQRNHQYAKEKKKKSKENFYNGELGSEESGHSSRIFGQWVLAWIKTRRYGFQAKGWSPG